MKPEPINKLEPITQAALQPGDILLCNIPALPWNDYLLSIGKVLESYLSTRKFDLEAATPLIHWVIGYLDEGHYFHASFWNGSKVVESRIKGGLRANDIATYVNDIVDVYRYRKDGQTVGSHRLPVAPLLQKAQELVDRHLLYGFDTAYLLAILCVSRWPRGRWVDCIRELLVRHAPSKELGEQIGKLIDELRPQINTLFEIIVVAALEVAQKYLLPGQGYVCSQTVAVIYNEAGDAEHAVGMYKIPKPTRVLKGAPPLLVAPPRTQDEVAACQDSIRELGAQLKKLAPSPAELLLASHEQDYDTVQIQLQNDTFYTPRDLAESSCTRCAGRLDLESPSH